ncbi:MAG: beta-Ala-His dipeptidase [Faecousia sp.]
MHTFFQNTQEERPLYFFEQIAKIPRNSGKEQGISNFIKDWAEGLGLWCFQDSGWNLILKKPGSPGCEALPPVILQAHMDMVCEKTADSNHNFDTDPIPLKLDGDWLCSAAETTLGADNGIGVAMCMAVLASEALAHPPLEVLLTVQEETSFYGAETVRWELLEGRRLINLDHAVDNEVLTGSCGGSGVEVTLSLEQQKTPAEGTCLQLTVSGLPGGHSGEDIHRGHGSAIQLLTRVLRRCRDRFDLFLCAMDSGSSRLAISRDASALIWVCGDASGFRETVSQMEQTFRREYQAVAPGLALSLTEADKTETCCTQASFDRVLAALSLFPDGIRQMNGAFPGMVESSDNLGVLKTEPGKLTLTAEIRGGFASTVEDLQERMALLAGLLGGSCRFFSQYAPWESRADSPLRAAAEKTYRALFGEELVAKAVHAGLECGSFLQRIPELDAIALGPNCQQFHSPQERMSISSAKRSWKLLQALLEALAKENS